MADNSVPYTDYDSFVEHFGLGQNLENLNDYRANKIYHSLNEEQKQNFDEAKNLLTRGNVSRKNFIKNYLANEYGNILYVDKGQSIVYENQYGLNPKHFSIFGTDAVKEVEHLLALSEHRIKKLNSEGGEIMNDVSTKKSDMSGGEATVTTQKKGVTTGAAKSRKRSRKRTKKIQFDGKNAKPETIKANQNNVAGGKAPASAGTASAGTASAGTASAGTASAGTALEDIFNEIREKRIAQGRAMQEQAHDPEIQARRRNMNKLAKAACEGKAGEVAVEITRTSSKSSGGSNLETKGKVGKWGRSAIGLGVMLAGGAVITNLMMGSNKGRLNNSQMYGQQPYTQY